MMYWRSYYKKHNTPLCTPASIIQAEIDNLEAVFHYTQSLATHPITHFKVLGTTVIKTVKHNTGVLISP